MKSFSAGNNGEEGGKYVAFSVPFWLSWTLRRVGHFNIPKKGKRKKNMHRKNSVSASRHSSLWTCLRKLAGFEQFANTVVFGAIYVSANKKQLVTTEKSHSLESSCVNKHIKTPLPFLAYVKLLST